MANKTIFTGNLGSDPEMRYRVDGVAVTTFSVAANSPLPNDKETTTWYYVTAWGGLAEHCYNVLSKGDRVYVEGRLWSTPSGHPRIYKHEGKCRAKFEIKAKFVERQ